MPARSGPAASRAPAQWPPAGPGRAAPPPTLNSAGGTYTELATGMHFLNNGQWAETQERIEVAADGSAAYARQGPCQAVFTANINSVPAIDMLAPDSKRLQSRVLGLAYYDAAS